MSENTKSIITIILIIATFILGIFFGPIVGIIGVILMWRWTKWKKWIKLLITIPVTIYVVSLLLTAVLLGSYLFLLRPVKVVGVAMEPNYKNNEYLMTRVLNKTSALQRGDVIILYSSNTSSPQYIKRIIGMPGDQVEITGGKVFLNGTLLHESYISDDVITNNFENGYTKEGQTITVTPDHYFVLGDNRLHSSDSREFGLVAHENIVGQVLFCYWNCK